jgi:peptidoglycan hydrolase CwlO-like protein
MAEKKLVNRSIVITLGLLCVTLVAAMVGTAIYYSNMNDAYTATHTHADSEYASLTTQLAIANENISSLNNQLSTLQIDLANKSTQSTDLQTQVNTLASQLKYENSTIRTIEDYYNSLIYVLNTQVHDTAIELTTANTQITSLQNQINALNDIANLSISTIWVNNQTVNQQAGSYTTWSQSASYAGYVSIQISSSTTSSTYANVTYSSHGVNYNSQINVGINGIAYFPILPSPNITVAVGNGLANGNATENVTVTYYY